MFFVMGPLWFVIFFVILLILLNSKNGPKTIITILKVVFSIIGILLLGFLFFELWSDLNS